MRATTRSAEEIYDYDHQEVTNAAEDDVSVIKKNVLRSKKEPSRLLDLVYDERSKIKSIGERRRKPVLAIGQSVTSAEEVLLPPNGCPLTKIGVE